MKKMKRIIVDIGSHKEEHLGSSVFITDIVIGMADGLTVPFALAAGLSGAIQSSAIVITAGIAEIVAGSIAMGLGGYRGFWSQTPLSDKTPPILDLHSKILIS